MSSDQPSPTMRDAVVNKIRRMEAKLERQKEHERMNKLTMEIEQKRLEMEEIRRKREGFRQPGSVKSEFHCGEDKPMLSRRPPMITLDSDEDDPPPPPQPQLANSSERARMIEMEKQLADLKNAQQQRNTEFSHMTRMLSYMAQGMPMNLQEPSTSSMNLSDEEFIAQQLRIRQARRMEQQQMNSPFHQGSNPMMYVPTPPSESPKSVDTNFGEVPSYFMNSASTASAPKSGLKRKASLAGSDNGTMRKSSKVSEEVGDVDMINIDAQCSKCSMRFRSIVQLLNHRLASHGKEAMLRCTKCNGRFDTRREIHKHLNLEYGIFNCSGCGKNWSNNALLQMHERSCNLDGESEESSKFQCSVCSQPHPSIEELLGHRQREHGLKTMLKCGICEKDFLSRSMIIRHMNIEYKLYPCKRCGNCLESEPDLVDHESFCEVEVLPTNDAEPITMNGDFEYQPEQVPEPEPTVQHQYIPNHMIKTDLSPLKRRVEIPSNYEVDDKRSKGIIQCSKCSMIVWSIEELLEHRESMHNRMDMLTCGICGEMFRDKKDIQRHLNVEYELFGCVNCEVRSVDQESMNEHEKSCGDPSTPVGKVLSNAIQRSKRSFATVLVCKGCEHATIDPSLLKNHEPYCKGKKAISIECSLCFRLQFKNIRELLDHRHVAHGEHAMMECGICKEGFTRRDAIANHLNVEYRLYTCLKCDQAFINQYAVFEHEKLCNDTPDPDQSFADVSDAVPDSVKDASFTFGEIRECKQCGKKSSCVEILDEHEKTCADPKFSPKCDCTICDLRFASVPDLLDHREQAHGRAKMLECAICSKVFDNRGSVRKHTIRELSMFPCIRCGKPCQTFSMLSRHERTCVESLVEDRRDREDTPKPKDTRDNAANRLKYQCEKCLKYTSLKYVLEGHEKDCLGVPMVVEIVCNLCKDVFQSVQDLTNHRSKVHGPVAAKTCGVCDKVIETKHGIYQHLTTEYALLPCMKCGKPQGGNYILLDHEKKCGKSEMDALTCCKCNKTSFSKEIMGEHEKKCDGEMVKQKDIQCVLCFEQFINIPSLLTHMSHNHCEEAMLTCGICQRKFESKNGIWGHLNIEYKVFPCLKCDKPQMSSPRLFEHEKMCLATMGKTETRNHLVQCGTCLKIGFLPSSARSVFDQHVESCNGEKSEQENVREIECIICNETFFTIQDIMTHRQRIHGEDAMMDCPICAVKYESKQGLLCHMALEYAVYPCSKCKKPCVSNLKKLEHEKGCKEDVVAFMESCEKCGKYSHKKEDLEKHMEGCEGVDEAEVKCIKCTHCEFKFINVVSLVNHLSKAHGDEAMLTCGLCDRRMETRHGIIMHLQLEYSTYTCSKCGKAQRNEKLLKEHEHSCNFEHPLDCKSCAKITFSKQTLEEHETSCDGVKEGLPVIKCEPCESQFITVNDFLIHRRQNHGGEAAMFKCVICNRKFTTKSGILWHLNIEFGIYPCSKCGHNFRSEQRLNDHVMKCNGLVNVEKVVVKDGEVQQCQKCQLKTFNSGLMDDHNEICTGVLPDIKEKIYSCHLCENEQERFIATSDLVQHREKFHEKEHWYDCQYCEKKFDSRRQMTSHYILEYGLYECPKCFNYQQSRHKLDEHLKDCKTGYLEEALTCENCKISTFRTDLMENHALEDCEVKESNNDGFPCKGAACEDQRFLTVFDLLLHREKVHGEAEMLKCEKCEKKMASRTGIYWHLNMEYEVYKCKHCEKLQPSAGFLKRHEPMCGKEEEKEGGGGAGRIKDKEDVVLSCSKCGISSYFKSKMSPHEDECDGSPTLTRGGKEITCNQCEDCFLSVPDLLSHRGEVHGEEEMLKCGICEKEFEIRAAISLHLMTEFGVHACTKCKLVMNCRSKRIEHEKSCRGNGMVKVREEQLETLAQCEKCKKGTYLQSRMDLHLLNGCEDEEIEVMDADNRIKFKCNECSTTLLTLHDLLNHRQREHSEEMMLRCLFCDKSYETRSGIQMHLALEYKLYPCKSCDKLMASAHMLKNHRLVCKKVSHTPSVKQELPNPSSCSKCQKWMYDDIILKEHEENCESQGQSVGKDLKCDLCDTVWITPFDYLNHRRDKHGNEAMLRCVMCSRRFESRTLVLRHIQTEYELYKCGKCERINRSANELQIHKCTYLNRSVSELIKENKLREYCCDKCGTLSFEEGLAKDHREKCLMDKLDKGTMEISCTLCDKKMVCTNDLRIHREMVHGVDASLVCGICERKFEDRKGMMAHLNIEYQIFKCRKCDRPMASYNRREIHESTCSKGGGFEMKNSSFNTPNRVVKNEDWGMKERMNDEGSYDCEKCHRKAYNAKFWKDHQDRCGGTEDEDVPKIDCSLCDSKYLNISDLLTHRFKSHGPDKMLRCGVCGKQSNSKALIYSHLTMEYSLFKCNNCMRCFESGQKLNEHKERCFKSSANSTLDATMLGNDSMASEMEDTKMEVDPVDEAYNCPNCHRDTENAEIFDEHSKNCQNDEANVKIDCWNCEKRFLTVGDLVNHGIKVHGEDEGQKCGFCKRKVYAKDMLVKHLTIEFQVHKCEKCNRCFDNGSKLEEHSLNCVL